MVFVPNTFSFSGSVFTNCTIYFEQRTHFRFLNFENFQLQAKCIGSSSISTTG